MIPLDMISSELLSMEGHNLTLLVLLVVFLFLAYYMIRLIYRTIVVAFLGAMFPFFAHYFLGLHVSTDWHTIVSFAMISAILYLLYEQAKLSYSFLKHGYKLSRILLSPFIWAARSLKSLISGKKQKKE